jgi:hypothetical protein
MTQIAPEKQGQSDIPWTSARPSETSGYVSGGLGVVGSNPATPTIFLSNFNPELPTYRAIGMPGKRSVSNSAESISAVGPGDKVGQGAPVEGGRIGKAGAVVEFAPMAERLIEPLSGDAKIESLKSKLLHRTTGETPPDPFEDVVAAAEVMCRNIYRKFLKDELYEIIKILDKMTDKDEVRKIYGALDRAIHNAVVLGMHTVGFIELRQEMEESARRANGRKMLLPKNDGKRCGPLWRSSYRSTDSGDPRRRIRL